MSDSASYPAKEIAELLMISTRRLNQLAAEGIVPKPVAGRFDLVASVQGFIRHKSQPGGESIAAEKLLKVREERLALERKRQQDERDFIAVDLVNRMIDEHIGAIRAEFEKDYQLTIPSLCEGKNSGAIRKICDRLFADHCRSLQNHEFQWMNDVKNPKAGA
jgi:hypothetical protein